MQQHNTPTLNKSKYTRTRTHSRQLHKTTAAACKHHPTHRTHQASRTGHRARRAAGALESALRAAEPRAPARVQRGGCRGEGQTTGAGRTGHHGAKWGAPLHCAVCGCTSVDASVPRRERSVRAVLCVWTFPPSFLDCTSREVTVATAARWQFCGRVWAVCLGADVSSVSVCRVPCPVSVSGAVSHQWSSLCVYCMCVCLLFFCLCVATCTFFYMYVWYCLCVCYIRYRYVALNLYVLYYMCVCVRRCMFVGLLLPVTTCMYVTLLLPVIT